MKPKNRDKYSFKTVEEMFGLGDQEISADLPITAIRAFKDHPFKVVDDEKMRELVESIQKNGVLSPVLVRELENGQYEMISGHRRLYAARLTGLQEIPAIVRDLDDEAAVIAMVDANIQREELLPSEKAFAYKMRLEARKRQGQRTDLTSCQSGTKLEAHNEDGSVLKRADAELAEQVGESARTIQRYIRLTALNKELLNMVDAKRIPFTIAIEMSYLPADVQSWLYEYIRNNGMIRLEQVLALRKHLEEKNITEDEMIAFLNQETKSSVRQVRKISLSEKILRDYFPQSYSQRDIELVIKELLDQWKQTQDGGIGE